MNKRMKYVFLVAGIYFCVSSLVMAQSSAVTYHESACPNASPAGLWNNRNSSNTLIRARIESSSLEIVANSNGCDWPSYSFQGLYASFKKKVYLNDQGIFLRAENDENHGFVFNGGINGIENRSYGGFLWKNGVQGASERMRLSSAGNLGIGVSIPEYRLEVDGRVRLRGVSASSLSPGTAGLWLHNGNEDKAFIGLRDDNTAGIYGFSGWGFTYNVYTGNVGIGTAKTEAPAYKLEVNGDAKMAGKIFSSQTPATTDAVASLKLLNGHNTIGDKWFIGFGSGTEGNDINDLVRLQAEKTNTGANFSILTGTAMTEKLRIDDAGSVGIGTASPTELLTVNGNVKCNALITDMSKFPDYVFQDDYKLASLSEVKSFIAANKRLPGMPSEKEILSKGLNLSQVTVISVEKLEELYLHVIHLQERLKTLEAKLACSPPAQN